ncbi:zinc finger and BTB domain-containing protein 38 [Nematolebias whitei]|uniref:zinc finger and BTB domain-containing protein 38 n=1 Tax=Nematolebias whitei TaxID=451745 RepID=UPI00189705D6|nr:zinc finger and BTB domain-containing protein 38 [Nematolebias whitei]XP_037533311.1 zinc finger and BTB domain-containing protein 38 [Nematolebias whitei]
MDSTHPYTVLNKLNEQRTKGLFCDITIVVEDVKFRAHKNILAACSGYFKNALTSSDTCSSSQVLELMDLRSEVFANILNFIYCSKVTSLGADDTRGLVAAGRRLGIPFLERLSEEKQDDCVVLTDVCTALGSRQTKKEVSRPEETDSTRGPRITNAFSINEVSVCSNPFTSVVQTNKEQRLPDVGHTPSNISTTSCINGNNESSHTLFDHSYAVCKPTEGKDSSQWDNNKVYKLSSQSKQLSYWNTGPLKKRHRLGGMLGRTILSRPAEPPKDKLNTITPSLSTGDSEVPATVTTPPPLFSEEEREKQMGIGLSAANNEINAELGPPPLSPHTEESILLHSCEQCPEIFPNKDLLTIHAEVHKKYFVNDLFCKFCSKKFIQLKRLHNHEQVCPSALKSPPRDVSAKDMDHDSEDVLDVESVDTQLPSADLSDPYMPESVQLVHSEHQQSEKTVKPGVGQRRYNCSVCKRVYVTLSSLKRHENVHSWQRAYPCHYCNKVFALAEYRTKHEIWHTGERRYQCIFCLETFMTYYILKNHQKSFHGIDPNISVKKKSANGGLKASVYPIKLYRLLPMKFRKKQYKTYSHTYSERIEINDPSSLHSNSLIPPFEENGLICHADTTSFPLTFMTTTKIVSPVVPRICFNKQSDHDMDQSLNSEMEMQGSTRKGVETRDPSTDNCDSIFSVQPNNEFSAGCNDDPTMIINSDNISHDVSLLNSLSTVKKLGELSASAKRVEEMTKEILQSSTENPMCDKVVETYIAKPACQGPSLESDSMPLCQITVKIGNEAIIRRQIKGSKLFPRKKRRTRKLSGEQSPSQSSPTRENPESPRLRFRPDISAFTGPEAYDDANDCDTADELWRPYYSYKAKKKRNKLKYKHSRPLFHQFPEPSEDRTSTSEAHLDRTHFPPKEQSSGDSEGVKHSPSMNHGPRATYSCDICDSSFITETGLRAHVIGSHPYFCRSCGKQGPPGEAPVSGDYICKSCMENGSCFDNTPRSPNPEKKYRCSFCPQRFLYLATKRSHEKKHQTENKESYIYDTFTSSSKYSAHPEEDNKQGTTKTKESDDQEGKTIKSESMDGEYILTDSTLKNNDAADFMSSTAYQDVSYSNIKRPLSPCSDSLPSLTSSKVKHKVVKKRLNVHHTMHLLSKKQICNSDNDGNKTESTGPRMHSHEKSNKLFGRNDSETNSAQISVHKPDKWVCKEEPFF